MFSVYYQLERHKLSTQNNIARTNAKGYTRSSMSTVKSSLQTKSVIRILPHAGESSRRIYTKNNT